MSNVLATTHLQLRVLGIGRPKAILLRSCQWIFMVSVLNPGWLRVKSCMFLCHWHFHLIGLTQERTTKRHSIKKPTHLEVLHGLHVMQQWWHGHGQEGVQLLPLQHASKLNHKSAHKHTRSYKIVATANPKLAPLPKFSPNPAYAITPSLVIIGSAVQMT